MALVSVVMPIYNAEKYLAQAIESVLNQSLKDFELILVNDGSKDTSLAICETYAKKDARVKVINQKNGGICAARNRGVVEASGEYLAFIDNDDVYLPDLLEENYRLAKKYDADILKYGNKYIKHRNFSPENVKRSGQLNEKNVLVLQEAKVFSNYRKLNEADWFVYVWDGFFKTKLIKKEKIQFDIHFKQGHEDRVFCMQAYQYSKCVIINPKIYYLHIVYKTSTSRLFSAARIDDTKRLLAYERQLFDILDLDALYPQYWQERIITYVILICSIFRSPEASFSLDEMQRILQVLRKEHYIKITTNSNMNAKQKLKNRIYAHLFERNYLPVLVRFLWIDRKVKAAVQVFKK